MTTFEPFSSFDIHMAHSATTSCNESDCRSVSEVVAHSWWRAAISVVLLLVMAGLSAADDEVFAHLLGDESSSPAPRGKIVFASDRDGDFDLFMVRADGSHRRKLTHNRKDDLSPSWAPGGRRIVFSREVSELNEEIFILNLRSGHERRVTRAAYADHHPDWGPRKNWIVYAAGDAYTDGADLVLRRLTNKKRRYIWAPAENDVNEEPFWSPDGRRIAFGVEWDGSYIAIARFCCRGDSKVLVSHKYYGPSDTNPAWSPDGNTILFASDRADDPGESAEVETDYDLYLVDSDGSDMRILEGESWHSLSGTWSPDGAWIAFYSDEQGSNDLYLITSDGGDIKQLTDHPREEIQPDWFVPSATGSPT